MGVIVHLLCQNSLLSLPLGYMIGMGCRAPSILLPMAISFLYGQVDIYTLHFFLLVLFIFVEMRFYLLSFLCDVLNKVYECI